MLDLIGTAAAAHRLESGRAARAFASQIMGPGLEAPPARLWFDGHPVSPMGAAFAAAAQIDDLDAHDGDDAFKGRAGAGAFCALAAAAMAEGGVSGPAAISALIAGYEIACRAVRNLRAGVAEDDDPNAWGGVAGALVVSRLLDLNPQAARQAAAIAERRGARSQMMKSFLPAKLTEGSGVGAMTAVHAAYLAETGFRDESTTPLGLVSDFWRDLGQRWLLLEEYVKPWPVRRWAHPAIRSALDLRDLHDFAPEAVEAVEIETFPEACALGQSRPESYQAAQVTISFPVAAALVRGRVDPAEITEGLGDPAILAMLDRIRVREGATCASPFPERRLTSMTITLRDGRRFQTGPVAAGGAGWILSEAAIRQKFHAYAAPALGAERAERIEALTLGLDSGASFDDLLAALTEPA